MTLLLLAATVLAGTAMQPPRVAPVLRLEFTANAVPVAHLDQSRQVSGTRTVLVDRLDLAHAGRLRHPVLGDLGFREHFFLAVRKRFRVLERGDYRFLVGSDDGFSLRIDNRPVCADPRPRALSTQSCGIALDAGEHEFALDYFQGGGQSGLTVQYARQDQRRNYWFGEDSPWFRFERESRR